MAKKKEELDGVWRTIGGRRVFIRKGQSLSDAMKESGKFKKVSDVKRGEYQELNDKIERTNNFDKASKYISKGDMHNATPYMNDYLEYEDRVSARKKQEAYSGDVTNEVWAGKHVEGGPNSYKERTTKQVNDEYNELSKKMQQDDYYYKVEDDKKLKELRSEYDTLVAKGQEDVNLTAYNKKEYDEKPFEYKESYNSYREKRDKLEGITRDELGNRIYDNMKDNTWTGKEYTNSEFLENLEDENWHTERKMLLDANLTEKQMEFVKNNTEFRNGSPSLDKEITNELIKGAKGEKYKTPKEIIAERNKAEIDKLKKELDIISKNGKYDDSGKSREGIENDYQPYVDKKEKYKQLTGQDYDDSNISIPYDKNKTYTFPNGTKIDQKLMKEWYSGQTPEKVKNDIEFEKRVLYDKSPSNRERANAQIKEMEKYYNSMEKYESRISDDFTTKEWKEGYGNNFGEGSWKGSKSNSGLYGKDLIKAIDDEVKKAYPEITTSRKTGRGGYTDSFSYDVMSSTKPLVRDIKDFSDTEINRLYNSGYNKNYYKTKDEFKNSLSKELKSGHFSINEYDIDNDYRLTPFGKSVFKDIAKVSNAYNYDESASQVDYYNTGHYINLGIGKYDKPFELKETKTTTKASTTALKNAYEEYKKTHKDTAMSFASFKKWYK